MNLAFRCELEKYDGSYNFQIDETDDPSKFQLVYFPPEDCLWAGGQFICELKISENYPEVHPEIVMGTPIYHPNITETGKICLKAYWKYWTKDCTIKDLMEYIDELFKEPEFDDAYRPDAADLHNQNPAKFEELARKSAEAAQY